MFGHSKRSVASALALLALLERDLRSAASREELRRRFVRRGACLDEREHVMELAARESVTIASLSVQSTSLDDVFVHYTGRALRDALQEANPLERGPLLRRA